MTKVLTWDWKDSLDIKELRGVLEEFGVSVLAVDTGGDEFAIVIGRFPMTQEEADAEYRKYCNG